jgi:hypothetical protein
MRERSSALRIVLLLLAFLMLSGMASCPRPSNTGQEDSGDMGGDTGGGMNGGGMGGGGY